MKALAVVEELKGATILGSLTGWECKEESGKLVKYKVHMTVRGDQQVESESFDPSDSESDLYTPVLKHHVCAQTLVYNCILNADFLSYFKHTLSI